MVDFFQIQQITITIAGLILGPFAGVLLAFWVNNLHRKKIECERQLFFKNLLLNEIERSIHLLEGGHPNLIPVDGWSSLVNSGELTLFPSNLAIHLSDIYSEIQNYNYEVNWIWQHKFVDLDEMMDKTTKPLAVHPDIAVTDKSLGPIGSESQNNLREQSRYAGKIRFYIQEKSDILIPIVYPEVKDTRSGYLEAIKKELLMRLYCIKIELITDRAKRWWQFWK